jgi:L-lactate dehydrogenase (cytochrome)
VRVLPEIVEAVKGRCEVWVDGGVRSGQDVLRARALGARGVLAGRLWLYGLGAGGRQGVLKALQIVQKELDVSMGLCGHTCIDNVDRQIVWEHSR